VKETIKMADLKPNDTRTQRKRKDLTKGRPPTVKKPQASLSKRARQTLIRSHHQLSKMMRTAEQQGLDADAAELKQRIEQLGGLKSYQAASIQGQANDHGGDSSLVLMEWLNDIKPALASLESKVRLLEVGALSVKNACSKSGLFEIVRIDLNSQSDGILEQDFMERPLPQAEQDRFDIVSLSLVLNFVPGPKDRGDMLKRTCQFLDRRASSSMPASLLDRFPVLFLVLPAACILNSRYMNEERLTRMMASLGYVALRRKVTDKLIYYLWSLRDEPVMEEQDFKKTEIRSGHTRNNFSVVLAS